MCAFDAEKNRANVKGESGSTEHMQHHFIPRKVGTYANAYENAENVHFVCHSH